MVLERRDDVHRDAKSIGELPGSTFSESDLALSFVVEGEYCCVFVPSICDGYEMNPSPVGMFRVVGEEWDQVDASFH